MTQQLSPSIYFEKIFSRFLFNAMAFHRQQQSRIGAEHYKPEFYILYKMTRTFFPGLRIFSMSRPGMTRFFITKFHNSDTLTVLGNIHLAGNIVDRREKLTLFAG